MPNSIDTSPPVLTEGAVDANSLFGKIITVTVDTYDKLKLDFTAATPSTALFNVDTSGDKISLSGSNVLYDADGAGAGGAISVATLASFPTLSRNIGVSINGNTISSSYNSWSSNVFSSTAIAADGYVSAATNGATIGYRAFGLSASYTEGNYSVIDYAIYMSQGALYVVEDSVKTAAQFTGTFVATDTFSIQRTSGIITYLRNNVVFYTSTKAASTGNLYLDCRLYTGSMSGVTMSNGANRDLSVTFNNAATLNAVNDITNAVTYTGNAQEVKLKATDINNLSSNELSVTAADNLPPSATVTAISEIAGTDYFISLAEASADITVKGTLSVASDGDKVKVTINGKDYLSDTLTGNATEWTVTINATDVATINSGTASASVVDTAGNASTAKTQTFVRALTTNEVGTLLTTQMASLTTLVNEVKVLATNNSGGSGSSTPASFVKPGS